MHCAEINVGNFPFIPTVLQANFGSRPGRLHIRRHGKHDVRISAGPGWWNPQPLAMYLRHVNHMSALWATVVFRRRLPLSDLFLFLSAPNAYVCP